MRAGFLSNIGRTARCISRRSPSICKLLEERRRAVRRGMKPCSKCQCGHGEIRCELNEQMLTMLSAPKVYCPYNTQDRDHSLEIFLSAATRVLTLTLLEACLRTQVCSNNCAKGHERDCTSCRRRGGGSGPSVRALALCLEWFVSPSPS